MLLRGLTSPFINAFEEVMFCMDSGLIVKHAQYLNPVNAQRGEYKR